MGNLMSWHGDLPYHLTTATFLAVRYIKHQNWMFRKGALERAAIDSVPFSVGGRQ
jgi:hypothetical protein